MLIERMNEKFISFTDDLIKSGMLSKRPDVAWSLHQTIAQSLFLANQVVSVAADDADPLSVERNVPETRASGADIDATEGIYIMPMIHTITPGSLFLISKSLLHRFGEKIAAKTPSQ
jgi:hypothetical protein